ncbi:hypothetical protein MKX40_17970 [Paenibacillus sp. FSL R5-0517]|uniref:hypothetical protein n=1 Tax=Paenibacillus sp. FSL R5-0517 TaxID=2921647 RepID=UPI0030DCA436
MPVRSNRPCGKPGCSRLSKEQYCDVHKIQVNHQMEQERGTAAEHCSSRHIEPHKGDMKLFWDHENWQPDQDCKINVLK